MHRAKAHRFGHSSTLVLSKTMSFGDTIVSLWFVISAFIRGLITYKICICACVYIYTVYITELMFNYLILYIYINLA